MDLIGFFALFNGFIEVLVSGSFATKNLPLESNYKFKCFTAFKSDHERYSYVRTGLSWSD